MASCSELHIENSRNRKDDDFSAAHWHMGDVVVGNIITFRDLCKSRLGTEHHHFSANVVCRLLSGPTTGSLLYALSSACLTVHRLSCASQAGTVAYHVKKMLIWFRGFHSRLAQNSSFFGTNFHTLSPREAPCVKISYEAGDVFTIYRMAIGEISQMQTSETKYRR